MTFLPGAASAVALAHFTERSVPALAPAVLLSFGFLAFTLAVSVASTRPSAPGKTRVLATLDLRRHRDRYAALFASVSVLVWIGSEWLLAILGIRVMAGFGVGHVLLMLALLFVSAWFVIGDAACSRDAIRKALLSAREEV